MIWTKDTTEKTAVAYKDSFSETIVGRYIDSSEQHPVVESTNLSNDVFLLDAGCGTGRYLASTKLGQKFVGLDISLAMLKEARKDLKRGIFVVGELEKLPFKDDTFDEVICVRVLQHIKNQQKAVKELSRVCKAGGDIIILCYNSWTLLCLYKRIRMSRFIKVINLPFKLLLRDISVFNRLLRDILPFSPWAFSYDNYCSLPELCKLFEEAGLTVVEKKGATIGFPLLLLYFGPGLLLEKFAPSILERYFKICRSIENRLAYTPPFNYLMDTIIVKGVKVAESDNYQREP